MLALSFHGFSAVRLKQFSPEDSIIVSTTQTFISIFSDKATPYLRYINIMNQDKQLNLRESNQAILISQ